MLYKRNETLSVHQWYGGPERTATIRQKSGRRPEIVWQKYGNALAKIWQKSGRNRTAIFAVESTMTGFLPPSSSSTGVKCLAAAADTIFATAVLPSCGKKRNPQQKNDKNKIKMFLIVSLSSSILSFSHIQQS